MPNADRPFLVKARDRIIQAPTVTVTHGEVRRVKRVIPGLGQEVERVGWDPSRLVIRGHAVWADETALATPRNLVEGCVSANGTRTQTGQGDQVAASASGVQGIVRRLDDQYAADLDRVDDAIAELEQRITELRRERKVIVGRAWTNAVRLWVDDVAPQGDEHRRVVTA